MISKNEKKYLPESFKTLDKFHACLIKRGNKARATSILMTTLTSLKTKQLIEKTSTKDSKVILNLALSTLMPSFILRRIVVAGKIYELPVPISSNRARFMATNWFIQSILKNNKNALTIPMIVTQQAAHVLNHRGSAYESLKAYIDIALDQRPFSRFIRKKRKTFAKSKSGRFFKKLLKRHNQVYSTRRKKKQRDRVKAKQTARRKLRTIKNLKNKI